MSNQTGHQKNADGAREAGEQYGNGSQVAKKQPNNPECSTARDTWHGFGQSADNHEKTKQSCAHQTSPAMKRWEDESCHDQPWHSIGSFSAFHMSRVKYVERGATSSNSAVAGSDE